MTEAEARINRVGPRHTLYLAKDLVEDSRFPFDPRQQLTVRVEDDHLIVEKPGRRTTSPIGLSESEKHELSRPLQRSGFIPVTSKAQKMLEMLRDIHEAEMLQDVVRHMPRREHALYLWEDEAMIERVLGTFLSPQTEEGAPKALVSNRPAIFGHVENVLSNELLSDGVRPERDIPDWISNVVKKNRTSRGGRIAMEDLSLFLHKYGEETMLNLEKQFSHRVGENLTFLCGYQLSNLQDPLTIERLISLHSYVILDNPLRGFRKEA